MVGIHLGLWLLVIGMCASSMVWHGILWYGRAGFVVGPLGRVGQRLLLRGGLLAPSQIIVRLNLGPRIALGEVRYRLKIKAQQLPQIVFFRPSVKLHVWFLGFG